MTSADSTLAGSDALVARAAIARVLGVDPGILRRDTPLASLGWDSLARVCVEDALAESEWECRTLAMAETVGDIADGCVMRSRS